MNIDSSAPGSLMPGTGRNGSLHRAFHLLRLVAAHPEGASVAELSQESDLPRSTVSRMLVSLFDVGAVARPGNSRRWVLGPAILELTNAVAPLSVFQAQSRDVLERVTEELGETSMFAIPTGPVTARVIEEVRGPKLLGVTESWLGSTINSPASGFVRQLLAELSEEEADKLIEGIEIVRHTPLTASSKERLRETVASVRGQDYVTVVDEFEEGLAGLSVPIRRGNRLLAMIAVYLPTARFTEAFQQRALTVLREAAAELE